MSDKEIVRYDVPILGSYYIIKQGRLYQGWHNGSAVGVLQKNGDLKAMETTSINIIKGLMKDKMKREIKDKSIQLLNMLEELLIYKI